MYTCPLETYKEYITIKCVLIVQVKGGGDEKRSSCQTNGISCMEYVLILLAAANAANADATDAVWCISLWHIIIAGERKGDKEERDDGSSRGECIIFIIRHPH